MILVNHLPHSAPAIHIERACAHRNDRVLSLAGELPPPSWRSLDAIHLATARLLGGSLARLVTYDERTLDAARLLGVAVASPG